jgi:hypothetical protein
MTILENVMSDQLSDLYAALLEGSYDGVDRVVWNAYFGMGQTPGGFRIGLAAMYGSDEDLDETHGTRMAGRFSRYLRAWAKAHNIPAFTVLRARTNTRWEKSTSPLTR